MNEFSENWRHLKAILAGYATRDRDVDIYSYEEQRQARALSIFLANARLATPKLDRETVEAILAGSLRWPGSAHTGFVSTNISLPEMEKIGMISFYADWCDIHSDFTGSLDAVDPSLAPLISAINHLKNIRYGREGCIRPHFVCGEEEFSQLLQAEFGKDRTVKQLVPALVLKNGYFSLDPGNRNFSSLISTYLWFTLRDTWPPEEAFSRWMTCLRVNCEWCMPVIFDKQQSQERGEFNEQILKFLAQDPELDRDIDFYIRQTFNEDHFLSLIRPVETHYTLVMDDQGGRSECPQKKEMSKTTLSTIDELYPSKIDGTLRNLEFVVELENARARGRNGFFYSWLLSSAVDASIRIQGQQLCSSGFTEDLVKLADSRPILKYILFVTLPSYEHSNYMILLLARPATCEVAFYHLAKNVFEYSRNHDNLFIKNLEDGYQKLVCREYVRTIEKEPDFITRILSVLRMLGTQCEFRSCDFSKGYEYRFLLNLLNTLTHQHVVQLAHAFSEIPIRTESYWLEQLRQHFIYLLGFCLIDRIESSGVDPTGAKCRALRESIQAQYRAEFTANLEGLSSLRPSEFFATLPWGKLIVETGPGSLLALTNRCDEWKQQLAYDRPNSYALASALRQYLQVLMSLGNPTGQRYSVTTRVQEIVRSCGFSPREDFVTLFGAMPGLDDYNLWKHFCSYSNSFHDELYDDFVARCVPSIPLDHLFVLLERCTIIARSRQLHNAIDVRQSYTDEDLGLRGLEQAFTSACDSGRTEIASKLLASAKKILEQDRFSNSSHEHIVRIRKVWLSYEYKWNLLELFETHKSHPLIFQKEARALPIPHAAQMQAKAYGREHHEECEYFRRQMIAMSFIDKEPAKSIELMEELYRKTQRSHHGFVLLYAHVRQFEFDNDKTRLQHALAYFLEYVKDIEPSQMNESWAATIIDAYRLTTSSDIDGFWLRLSSEQHTRLSILSPYCKALIVRGDYLTAQNILGRYQKMNPLTPNELGIDDLISDLAKVEGALPSMEELIQMLNEGAQRSIVQLRQHYSAIVSKEFEEYVEIVRPENTPHEYLRDAVLAVAKELVLRKRNLQVEYNDGGVKKYRIMIEDLINDWFTSLFDHRMAHARVGFRDQKRAGQSASGQQPGEIDGFITSGDNKRLAIFEAFRLSSLDTSTISKHLNKISGYDAESLSPVFIVGYCDVNDFCKLIEGYEEYISSLQYTGYKVSEDLPVAVTTLDSTDHVWLGMETRRRDHKDIVFYHIMINLKLVPSCFASDL